MAMALRRSAIHQVNGESETAVALHTFVNQTAMTSWSVYRDRTGERKRSMPSGCQVFVSPLVNGQF